MISRVSSNTKILDFNTGFGDEKGECSRRKAQHRGPKKEPQDGLTGVGGLKHAGAGLGVKG